MAEKIVVMKFGGKSLASLELFQAVAQYIAERITRDNALRVVAVVSAMGKRTDAILANIKWLHNDPPQRELAAALQVGEAESAPYLATALTATGVRAQSYNAWQLGIQTAGGHEEARITTVNQEKLLQALSLNQVAVVTGFQGINELHEDELTVLGRGGSDTTAVALAATLSCGVEFYKAGVAGVHAYNPNISPRAKVLTHLTYDEAMMLTEYGYEFLMTRSLDIARRFGIRLEFRQTPGLPNHDPWVVATMIDAGGTTRIERTNQDLRAIAVKENQALIVVSNVPNIPGWSRQIYDCIDLPFIDSYQAGAGSRAFVVIISHEASANQIAALLRGLPNIKVTTHESLANITLIDRSANQETHIFARIGKALETAEVNIQGQYSSGFFIHTLVNLADKDAAVLAIGQEFGLEEQPVSFQA